MGWFVKMKFGSMVYLVIWGTKSNIADIICQFYWSRLIEYMDCFVEYESVVMQEFDNSFCSKLNVCLGC